MKQKFLLTPSRRCGILKIVKEELLKQEGLQMKNLGLFKVAKVYGFANVHVCQNGMVAYAVVDGVHVYPYHNIGGHWVGRSRDCTLSALRHGIKRGTMEFM